MPAPQIRRLILGGLAALALLALGEAASGAFPDWVAISVERGGIVVDEDGQRHVVAAPGGIQWRSLLFESPLPADREYQIDGTDLTATRDRDFPALRAIEGTPLYAFDAWLRDEGSYSRWDPIEVDDPSGKALARGLDEAQSLALPDQFRVLAGLRRPEAPARVWLVSADKRSFVGIELDRDQRAARWLESTGGPSRIAATWFFPEDPVPFAANLLHLLGRSAAAGYGLFLIALALASAAAAVRRTRLPSRSHQELTTDESSRLARAGSLPLPWGEGRGEGSLRLGRPVRPDVPASLPRSPVPVRSSPGPGTATLPRESPVQPSRPAADGSDEAPTGQRARRWGRLLVASGILVASVLWLGGAAWVAVVLYHQLPHVLDAVSYYFQSRVFDSGRLWLNVPPLVDALKGPFQVVWDGRWFSQYPPGAPAAYALGGLVGLAWLVGPLCALFMILAIASTTRDLFGDGAALGALFLGLISPFVLFQAGSFLSHPVAGAFLAGALAAWARGERTGHDRWCALSGALFGAAFDSRETAALAVGFPVFVRLLVRRRWDGLNLLLAAAAPFGLLYLADNYVLTGSPFVLPRSLFSGVDHFGFGDGIGFYGRHTLAAGLANLDEQWTLLQFDFSGWPPLFSFGLLLLPFLVGRPDWRELFLGGGALVAMGVYVAYFYHGNVLGPRYDYEALPLLLPLAARGLQVAVQGLRRLRYGALPAYASVAVVVGLLTANDAGFYLPRQVERRTNYEALPDGSRLDLPMVEPSLGGAVLKDVPEPALVLVDEFWLYNVVLSPLNCARPDLAGDVRACPRLFVLATTPADEQRLIAQYPNRTVLRAVQRGATVEIVPAA